MTKKEKLTKVAKIAAKFGVTGSVSKIVHDVIDSNVVAETPFQQVQVWVGAIAISIYAQEEVWNTLETKFNRVKEAAEESDTIEEAALKVV